VCHNQCTSRVPYPPVCMLPRHRHSCNIYHKIETCHTEPHISSALGSQQRTCSLAPVTVLLLPQPRTQTIANPFGRPGFTHTRKIAAGHLHARHCNHPHERWSHMEDYLGVKFGSQEVRRAAGTLTISLQTFCLHVACSDREVRKSCSVNSLPRVLRNTIRPVTEVMG
jgi:hypothetical protein